MPVRAWTALTGAVLMFAVAGCAGGTPGTGTDPSGPAPSPSASEHAHGLREIDAEGAPSVRMEVAEDPSAGWNVHLEVDGFEFTPERVGAEVRTGEGHAHLYVDEEKVARVYGPWHHLPASAVPEGEHILSVRLSANDHSSWAVGGEPISDSIAIEVSGDDVGPAPAAPSGDSAPAGAADVTVEISVRDGAVAPPPGRVKVEEGQNVRIEVDSDTSDTVHLHGYDIEQPVGPGEPAVLAFTADQSGLFELEMHESGTLLTQIAVE